MIGDFGGHRLSILELIEERHVIEERIVPGVYVVDSLVSQRDMKNGTIPHEIVQRDLNQTRGLANTGARHDDSKVSLPKATMHGRFKNSEWAL